MTTELEDALMAFINTIEATGGVRYEEDTGRTVPVADDWPDLADAYIQACKAMGRKPKTTNEEDSDG